MNLIIVESPTKANTLSRFLGKDYIIDSSMGHIRDLPKSKLGVDVDKDFKPDYVLVEKRGDTIKKIKSEAKKAKKIYLATDPDREGEAIAYHIKHILTEDSKPKIPSSRFKRVTFHEVTKAAVEHALSTPGDINTQLFNAQQARRVLDRLVGYKLSPLLWKKIRTGLSAGRVQSAAVRLIVEREREIDAFRAEEYWEIFCEVKAQSAKRKGEEFLIKLIKIGNNKAEIKSEKQANGIVGDLEKATYIVTSIDKREAKRRPAPPFTTSTLTQTASRVMGWSAKYTMSIAQKLYEQGLITYHRTDSMSLSHQAVTQARNFIQLKYGKQYLPEAPRLYKTRSKLAQEAHEAIRPTNVKKKGGHLKTENRQKRLYDLVWKRFVACQMSDAILGETTINVEAKNNNTSPVTCYLLRTKGAVTRFDGWSKVYGGIKTSNGELPELKDREALQLIEVIPEQKFTLPPPRFTEASLVKELEKLGIGRPSTYAPIISTIQDRRYVEKHEGKFHATPVGMAVNDFLVKNFPNIVDYKFTASMEDNLDQIADGKKKWVPIISEFWNPFSKKLEGVEEKAKRVEIEVEKTGKKCPKCAKSLPAGRQGNQVIRVGRFGKFLSCSRFPSCDWKATYIEKIGMKCPDCGKGDVIVRKTRKGRVFYGCSRYPKCKWASWTNPRKKDGKKEEQT